MNPALVKALKSRSKPASGSAPSGSGASKGHAHHFREMKRHLEEGAKGSRAGAKVKLKLALHHAGLMDQPEPDADDATL